MAGNIINQPKFMEFVDKLTVKAGHFSSQRHLSAVRDAFITLMPIIIAASFFILINNVILHPQHGLAAWMGLTGSWVGALREISLRIYNGSLNILSFMATIMIAWRLAQDYGEDGIIYAILALGILIVFFPTGIHVNSPSGETFLAPGLISSEQTGASGMFVGILVALSSTECLRFLHKQRWLMIKMPESVPPAVSKSFSVMLPVIAVFTIFSTLSWGLEFITGRSLYQIVNWLIQTPLQNIMQGWSGVNLLVLIQNGLWWVGIHGSSIMYPITETTLMVAVQENSVAFAHNAPLPHIVTKPFIDAFGYMGGGGQTIGLLIALLIAAKRSEYRAIGKLSSVAAVFNINEPLIFGLPVIFNPVLLIPFLLSPVVCLSIAWLATASELISRTSVLIPWTTPPVISAFLATSGDWRAALLAALLIIVSTLIYLPFVILLDRKQHEAGAPL
ncbi:PTS sugar transporter subunit IIC [Cronobacter malonaticus]